MFHVLVLAIPFLLTGCTLSLAPAVGSPDPRLTAQAAQAVQNVRDIHLTADVEVKHPFLDDKMVVEAWYVPNQDWLRLEILESAQPSFKGMIAASKGSEGWTYHPAEQRVDVGSISVVKPAIAYDVISSTLQVWFAGDMSQAKVTSPDYVDHRWVFRLAVPQQSGTCSLWLEQGSLLPVKVQCENAQLGQYTATIRDVEYNLGLTEDLFNPNFLPSEKYNVRRIR